VYFVSKWDIFAASIYLRDAINYGVDDIHALQKITGSMLIQHPELHSKSKSATNVMTVVEPGLA